jgi:hypothetical protein
MHPADQESRKNYNAFRYREILGSGSAVSRRSDFLEKATKGWHSSLHNSVHEDDISTKWVSDV